MLDSDIECGTVLDGDSECGIVPDGDSKCGAMPERESGTVLDRASISLLSLLSFLTIFLMHN